MHTKKRNLWVGVIILAVIITTVMVVIINNATNEKDDYKSVLGTNFVTIYDSKGSRTLPSTLYLDFADSEYLKKAIFTATVPIISETMKTLDDNTGGKMKVKGAQDGVMPGAKLYGSSDTEALIEFTNGLRKIIDGRMYQDKNEALISKELAELNYISVGDVITVENISLGENGGKIIYSMTIVGIFSDTTNKYENPLYKIAYLNRRNEILTSVETILGAQNAGKGTGVEMDAVYYLDDPNMLDSFEYELRIKGLPDDFHIKVD